MAPFGPNPRPEPMGGEKSSRPLVVFRAEKGRVVIQPHGACFRRASFATRASVPSIDRGGIRGLSLWGRRDRFRPLFEQVVKGGLQKGPKKQIERRCAPGVEIPPMGLPMRRYAK